VSSSQRAALTQLSLGFNQPDGVSIPLELNLRRPVQPNRLDPALVLANTRVAGVKVTARALAAVVVVVGVTR